MNLPKQFTLFGETIKVKQVVKVDKEDNFGEYNPVNNTIKIKKSLNEEQKLASLYHEIIHCLTLSLGYNNLYNDEVYTDTMGKGLHQILNTFK